MHREVADPASFPPLERVRVEQLACCEPLGLGLHLTHWSSRSLAAVATALELVPHMGHSTVALILRQADLQPHRCRYWKTPTFDAAFAERAAPVLWCYEHVQALAQREEFILCWDEKPNLQALERTPCQAMRPGHIERQEFEYRWLVLNRPVTSKESQDRISGSGVWGRAVDTNVSITAHESENAFTLAATSRGFKKIEPFVIRWEYPLMVRDDGLNPDKLKTAICKKPVYTAQDIIRILVAEKMPTVKLREAVIESTGMSRSMFYELLKELKTVPGVTFDEEKQLWKYEKPKVETAM